MKATVKKNQAKPATAKSNGRKVRVLLVDDHPIVREGLARVIDQEPDLRICGEAASVTEALAVLEATHPQIVVSDLSLENSSGLDLIRELKRQHPELPVLILSMHDESMYGERALRAGARGYVMKQEPPTVLLAAIRKVLNGERWMSRKLTSRLLLQLGGVEAGTGELPVHSLSDRELEVFQMLGQGLRPRVVGERLKLSVKTVETYCASIRRKLNLSDMDSLLEQAVGWAHSRPFG
jgi:DNA-binding NarL/FixJ family response regulator